MTTPGTMGRMVLATRCALNWRKRLNSCESNLLRFTNRGVFGMNTNELRAAAAKVLSAQSTVPLACVKLARHVQRMYDETPVDQEWWKSVVGEACVYHGVLSFESKRNRVEVWCTYRIIAVAKTRGDVRRLCEALGIELREGE